MASGGLIKSFRKGVAKLDTASLVAQYPPKLFLNNKKVLLALSCPQGTVHKGTLKIGRWGAMPLPKSLSAGAKPCANSHREDGFCYERNTDEKNRTEFYVNFADKHLFGYYGGPLFAQDEMQANEHPALCSLREFLISKENKEAHVRPFTTDVDGNPTPIIIMGAERRVAVATNANKEAGRPKGLYGNAFAAVSAEAIQAATTVIKPPTITHLIAMEAPKYGSGEYRASEINLILTIAYTSFAAARAEAAESLAETSGLADNKQSTTASTAAAAASSSSATAATAKPDGKGADSKASAAAASTSSAAAAATPTPHEVIIHTGNWGTGAYGGNKVLMALLQMAAAHMAGIDALVYHTFAAEYTKAYVTAKGIWNDFLKAAPTDKPMDLGSFIQNVQALKLKWGQSDGN